MAVAVARVGTLKCELGEGPVWDPVEAVLYFVDSLKPAIHRLDPATGALDSWDLPRPIGSLALRAGGGAIVALSDGLFGFDFATGALDPIAAPEAGEPRTRFNDGKTDRQGRFVVGSMDRATEAPLGALYRLDPDHTWQRLESGITASNGPCFSPDGRTFYFTDSPTRKIHAYDYDPATGAIANKRVFVDLAEHHAAGDGATVDADGGVWSALVTRGRIARFTAEGALDRVIEMPVRTVTSVQFGGPDLDRLFVTSLGCEIWGRVPPEEAAGGLFVIDGLDVTGLPEPRFAG